MESLSKRLRDAAGELDSATVANLAEEAADTIDRCENALEDLLRENGYLRRARTPPQTTSSSLADSLMRDLIAEGERGFISGWNAAMRHAAKPNASDAFTAILRAEDDAKTRDPSFHSPTFYPLAINFDGGSVLVKGDGTVEYRGKYDPDQAARTLWEALARNAPKVA